MMVYDKLGIYASAGIHLGAGCPIWLGSIASSLLSSRSSQGLEARKLEVNILGTYVARQPADVECIPVPVREPEM